LAGHAEAPGGDLVDGAPAPVAVRLAEVARRVLAALAGVRLAADPIHGDGKGLVGLLADRAVGHGAGREVAEDRLDRLHLVERDRRLGQTETEQAAKRGKVPALIVDGARVFLEDPVLAAPRRVLELLHRLGIEEVKLPVAAPLVLAAPVE